MSLTFMASGSSTHRDPLYPTSIYDCKLLDMPNTFAGYPDTELH
jgi:hypothetical protein